MKIAVGLASSVLASSKHNHADCKAFVSEETGVLMIVQDMVFSQLEVEHCSNYQHCLFQCSAGRALVIKGTLLKALHSTL